MVAVIEILFVVFFLICRIFSAVEFGYNSCFSQIYILCRLSAVNIVSAVLVAFGGFRLLLQAVALFVVPRLTLFIPSLSLRTSPKGEPLQSLPDCQRTSHSVRFHGSRWSDFVKKNIYMAIFSTSSNVTISII